MKIKCTNCRNGRGCDRPVVIFFEYIGAEKNMMSMQDWYIASCDIGEFDYNIRNWKKISKEEYIVARVLHD